MGRRKCLRVQARERRVHQALDVSSVEMPKADERGLVLVPFPGRGELLSLLKHRAHGRAGRSSGAVQYAGRPPPAPPDFERELRAKWRRDPFDDPPSVVAALLPEQPRCPLRPPPLPPLALSLASMPRSSSYLCSSSEHNPHGQTMRRNPTASGRLQSALADPHRRMSARASSHHTRA